MESQKACMNILSQNCKVKNPKILDIGCGSGYFLNTLGNVYRSYDYVGVDLNQDYLEIGKTNFEKNRNVNFFHGDAQNLHFKENQFDIVISVNTFPHIPNIRAAINECLRVSAKFVLIRLLIDKELTIVKKSLDLNIDANGEPTNYMLVNTYTEEYLKHIIGKRAKVEICDDEFDPNVLKDHHENHKEAAGEHIATTIIDGKQQKGILLLNWKFLFLEL